MDLLSVLAAVRDSYKLPDAAKENDRLRRACCEALRRLRGEEVSFNRFDLALTTVADQAEYERGTSEDGATKLPYDFWGVLGDELWNATSGARRRIERRGAATQLEAELGPEVVNSAYPYYFTVERHKLRLHPPPSDAYAIEGRYLKDLGTPLPVYMSSNQTYKPVAAFSYDSDADTYTDILSNLLDPDTSTKVFPAGAGEDDVFYLGFERLPTTPLTLNVGTGGAGTYTATWEHYTGYGWVTLPGITDNTNSLKTSGSNTVVFTALASSPLVVNASKRLYWIRLQRDSGTVTTDPTVTSATFVGGDAWEYYLLQAGGGVEKIDDTYTNDWFERGFQVLMHATAYQHQLIHNQDLAQAQAAQARFQDAMRILRSAEAPLLSKHKKAMSLGW